MTKADEFYAGTARWQVEMKTLRAILLGTPLTEEFKWRSPCYTFEGGNIVAVWGMKDFCTLSFFKGVLLKDEAGLLAAPGENSRSMRLARFTSVAGIEAATPAIISYVEEAIALEQAGVKVELPKGDFVLPEELLAAFKGDPALETAFNALTPGRQRGYCLHFAQPKNASTRHARIEKSIPRIMAGKGMNER
ncbi:YdeI/OmpD-associated family protein [Martelella soudanensis]|uniref:YdeI/OmpD-associated family protein n=1 Tax=unclassified Martelella TaxID=2629616 RepID=UPI001FEE1DE2|nr:MULTISPECIES: YdeI/OmpD-associated family protein [unclassified Martelella]